MFIKVNYYSCKSSPWADCFLEFNRDGFATKTYEDPVRIPIRGYRVFRVYPSDVNLAEKYTELYDFDYQLYEDESCQYDATTHQWDIIPGKSPSTEGLGTIKSQFVSSSGAEWFVGGADDFERVYRDGNNYDMPLWSVWTDEVTGDMLQWDGAQWVPYGGGGAGTVDFQFPMLPDPSKYGTKVIQFIGTSTEGYRMDLVDEYGQHLLDPDIGKAVFKGDWVHSYKKLEFDPITGEPIIDPETGEQKWHWAWEILFHAGQIIEVDTLDDSNWKPKKEFLGYRIYLTKPWNQEILDYSDPEHPEGKSYVPPRYRHWTRGWYQIWEKVDANGYSANPQEYQWVRVQDEVTTAHPKRLEGIPERYYDPSNTTKNKPYCWWVQDSLEIITDEDQCTVRLKAHYSEAMQNKVNKDHAFDPASEGEPENPLAKHRQYQYVLLEGLPCPVPAAKKTYECNTDSPYMAANLDIEVTDNGIPYVPGDEVYIPTASTGIGDGVLGVDWSRTVQTIKGVSYEKPLPLTAGMIKIMTEARYQNKFKNEPVGILKIPDGSIPVSCVDVDITYDWDNQHYGPQDDYVAPSGLMGMNSPKGLTMFKK